MSPTRRRLVGTVALCGTASVLFLAPQAWPGAEPSAFTVLAGLLIPPGVAGLLWAVTYRDARDLDTRTRHQAQPERQVLR